MAGSPRTVASALPLAYAPILHVHSLFRRDLLRRVFPGSEQPGIVNTPADAIYSIASYARGVRDGAAPLRATIAIWSPS